MKRLPFLLALFFVFITIQRVAQFVADGLHAGISGWAFSLGLATAVYVSAFFVRWPSTRFAAIVGLLLFGVVDLFFNELDLVRALSPEALVLAGSNFLFLNADALKVLFQVSALIYGCIPTLAAAVLGLMASQAEQLKAPGLDWQWPQLGGLKIGFALQKDGNAQLPGANTPQLPAQILAGKPRRWGELTDEEIARIPAMNRAEGMAFFGVSDGAFGDWKRRISSGERPR